MGMSLPYSSTMSAVDAEKATSAADSARALIGLIERDLRPLDILTKEAFENAITVLHAIGGSTNAIVHLLALAGRVPGLGPTQPDGITLDDFDNLGRKTPMLVDLKPSGEGYMEDFRCACSILAFFSRLAEGNPTHSP